MFQSMQRTSEKSLKPGSLVASSPSRLLPNRLTPSATHLPITTFKPSPYGLKKALIVGINYIQTPYELAGCVSDALNMKKQVSDFFPHMQGNPVAYR
jgi:hypothetical protein